MDKDKVKAVVESVRHGSRRVKVTFSESAGVPEYRLIEDACVNDYVRFTSPAEESNFSKIYHDRQFDKMRTFVLGITDRYYEHGLDWLPALTPFLADIESV